jgi:uncharacterized protein HemX
MEKDFKISLGYRGKRATLIYYLLGIAIVCGAGLYYIVKSQGSASQNLLSGVMQNGVDSLGQTVSQQVSTLDNSLQSVNNYLNQTSQQTGTAYANSNPQN